MMALGFKEHGKLDKMSILEMPIPIPGPREVLVELKVSAFNHLDIWVRKGWPGLHLTLPHICGSDGAGIVRALGPDVDGIALGERVAINPGINFFEDEFTISGQHSLSLGYAILGEQVPGTHAEFIVVPAKSLITLPPEISFEAAAAVGLVGITSWRMLIHRAKIQYGQKILIIGAGGGVNSLSIQLAKLMGCQVVATTMHQEKVKRALALGAEYVINSKEEPQWEKKLLQYIGKQGFDVIIDNVGSSTLARSLQLVKRGGSIVMVGATSGPLVEIDLRYIFSKQIKLIGSTMGNSADYHSLMQLVFSKKISPVIHANFPLKEGIKGMALLEEGSQFGKILLTR
jgi:NADPH:quinone reductase-like Zn-dependent oxidoreductase